MPSQYPTGKVRNTAPRLNLDFLTGDKAVVRRSANDNLPRAANDNVRGRLSSLTKYRRGFVSLARTVSRHPVANAALVALDIYTRRRQMTGGLTAPAHNNYWAGKGFIYIGPGPQDKGKDGGGWKLGNHAHPVLLKQFTAPRAFDTYTWPTGLAVDWYTTSDEYLFFGTSVWDTYNIWHKNAGNVSRGQPWKLGRIELPNSARRLDLVSMGAALDPSLQPVITEIPWPHPAPLPFRLLSKRPDTMFRETGPKRVARPATAGGGRFRPGTSRTLIDKFDGKITVKTRVGTSIKKPPGKGTKEKKQVAGIVRSSGFGRTIGALTEVVDFVEAVYKGLPPAVRHKHWKKNQTPMEKAQLIYRYAHRLDINVVVRELIFNELEDFLIGKIGKRAAKANRDLGFSVGIQFGFAL